MAVSPKDISSKNPLNKVLDDNSFQSLIKLAIICLTFTISLLIISDSIVEYNKISHNCTILNME